MAKKLASVLIVCLALTLVTAERIVDDEVSQKRLLAMTRYRPNGPQDVLRKRTGKKDLVLDIECHTDKSLGEEMTAIFQDLLPL